MKSLYPNLYAAMEKKDAALLQELQGAIFPTAWDIWRMRHPEDFVGTSLSTTLAEMEADPDRFIKQMAS